MEEIKAMSLKAYDLIWVVGKSAAWRYPGEITDFSAFAPPIPEQLTDLYTKRKEAKQTEAHGMVAESTPVKKVEKSDTKFPVTQGWGIKTSPSIYVNLPAEKKTNTKSKDRIQFEPDIPPLVNTEPAFDYYDLYKRQPARSSRFSGKVLWMASIALLFGAGILTGLFISDRKKFFSATEKTSPKQEFIQTADKGSQREIQDTHAASSLSNGAVDNTGLKMDSVKTSKTISGKTTTPFPKKSIQPASVQKDSLAIQTALLASIKMNDSIKQSVPNKSDLLYQKIKAHPEEYIDLVTGRYSTGVFGGISSFPVTITNNSPVKLDLIVVDIDYVQSNEKVFKTESLSFNDLEPGETVTLKAPKSTRGVKINTKVHIVNLRQSDLSSSN